MSSTPIPAQFNDRRRRFIDRLTRRVVKGCGLAILLVMLLLFIWLLWVVVPLFSSPSMDSGYTLKLPDAQPAVALGMDAEQKWGWRIDRQGRGFFIPLDAQPPSAAISLYQGAVSATTTADKGSVLLNGASGLVLVQPQFMAAGQEPVWKFPLGNKPLAGSNPAASVASIAHPDEHRWLVAQASPDQLTLLQYHPDAAPLKITLGLPGISQLLLSPDGQLLFGVSGAMLRVWHITPEGLVLRDTHTLTTAPKRIMLLSGGNSLLVADDRGIAQWFDIASETGPNLRFIRRFAGANDRGIVIVEAHRRVFATLSPGGELNLFASKQLGAIFSRQLKTEAQSAVFAPHGDGLLLENMGLWRHYRLSNPWPDISWRSLWQKVWYENYPSPDYVWQSTSANDEYQGKYSLIPMVIGTLKAAGLAMLFATPLALAAAMYTAWFMTPGLRRWVKPAIEMMGALPSVVIGLIAGLWLAPQLADRLLGVLLLPLMLAAVLLLCSWGSLQLTPCWRRRLCGEGQEIWLLMPLLLLTGLFCLWLLPIVEHSLFGKGIADRFSGGYQQRNLLIAGVAMGFALVPLIFTLAEEAIYSVPAALGQGSLALGATPWQTLTRVVVPGASAGIFAALMIGFGRALGETMIVLMVTGNTPVTEGGLLQGVRSLAANVAIEMPEAAAGSAHYRILFLSALVLLIFTLVVNTLAELIRQRLRRQYSQQEEQG